MTPPAAAPIVPTPPGFAGWRRTAWWTAVGYGAVLVAAYLAGEGVPGLDVIRQYLQYLPLTIGGGSILLHAARAGTLQPATQRAARCLAVGLFGSTIGMLLYVWSHEVADAPYGVPIAGDTFFIASYALILVGLLSWPRRHAARYGGWKAALDTAVVLVSAALVGWHLVIAPTTRESTGALDLVLRIAYPVLDLGFLLAINAIIIAGGPAEHHRAFRWAAIAMLSYVAAESLYQVLYYGVGEAHPIAERLSEIFFVGAYLSLVRSGLHLLDHPRRTPALRLDLGTAIAPLPLVATAAVGALLLYVAFTPWQLPTSPLMVGMVILAVLLVTRQSLTALQNARLLRAEGHREAEARAAALVRHATDLILLAGEDGTIRFASPSIARILGRTPDQVVGQPLATLLPDPPPALFAEAATILTTGGERATTTLTRLQHADGSWLDVEIVATDLTAEPAVRGIILVGRDLTERNAFESQLRQAQKREAVGRLAGGVAHDFNNLLTTILASTELLVEDAGTDPTIREELDAIRQAATSAAALTGQLLAFSRQEAPAVRPTDLDAVVGSTMRMFGRLAGPDLRVERHAEPELPPAIVDANQISQVLLNLALNARDAMPAGGTLTVRLERAIIETEITDAQVPIAPGEYVVLEVRDTGVGMDPTTLAQIFEPFFTTKAAGHGTGLGLPTTRTIIRKHGGGLVVRSHPGSGTTVRVFLPAAAHGPAAADISPPPTVPMRRGSERILLVEDEAPVRDVTRRILERLGYDVEVAADAEQARRVLSLSGVPDLLLTDVIMPGESGVHLAQAMRARHRDLPVLFISGYTGDELARQGLLDERAALLQKPFTPAELADRVRAVLDG
ncbi:MAG TPA: ATP-binding protein [Gemmatimonadales bacterium]|nr:ATP-binding protein [Gemmatimonadales bacterium]